jgi:anti-sigma factor RsiW
MKDYHPSPDLLKRFLDGTLNSADPTELRRVVRHLLTRCPACQAACQEIIRELVQGQAEVLRIVDWEA